MPRHRLQHAAKAHTAGVNVAQFFMTRVQSEVSLWPADPSNFVQPLPSSRYPLLHYAANTGVGTWLLIPQDEITDGIRDVRIGEYLGHSDGVNDAARYCVNYMVEPLGVNLGNITNAALRRAMVWKIRVRVAWPKSRQYDKDLWQDCDPSMWATGGKRLSNSNVVELMSYATRERARGRLR